MKKYAWVLALALPVSMAFVSCGDDNEETVLTLDQTTASVNYNQEITLTASEKGAVWSSDDEFVATVDQDGKVKALHVGETTITATKDGSTAKCTITVNATDDAYQFPLMSWGSTLESIKGSVGSGYVLNEDHSDDSTLFYGTGSALGYPWYVYTFKDNALDASSFTVQLDEKLEAFDKVSAFLDQYLQAVDTDEDTMTITYANAMSVSDATLICELAPIGDNLDHLMASFTPRSNSRSVSDAFAAIERHRAVIAKILK